MAAKKKPSVWTCFMDMCSGGGQKEKYSHIYIEAPQVEADVIFYNRFGHNPHRVSCTCCGDDYSISEGEIVNLTAYDRNCASVYIHKKTKKQISYDEYMALPTKERYGPKSPWVHSYAEVADTRYSVKNKHYTLEEYKKLDNILFIPKEEIKEEERHGELPKQGFVWVD